LVLILVSHHSRTLHYLLFFLSLLNI
jgi:hypothetical protein